MQLKSFNALKKNLKREALPEKAIKVALLGDSATQLLKTAIKGYGYEEAINFEVYEADYDQIEQEVYNQGSELYDKAPEFVIICPSSEKLLHAFHKASLAQQYEFAKTQNEKWVDIYQTINSQITTKVILFNFPFINDNVFGNYANKVEASFSYQLKKLNLALMEQSFQLGNLFIFDFDALQSQIGYNTRLTPKFYYSAQMVMSIEVLPRIAKELADIMLAIKGSKLHKCLILDLDNTTWGGIIGDDGIEGIQVGGLGLGKAFTELQQWALALKKRGIILCICSKNTDHIAKEPFEKHPDMVLRLSDISVFVANWENKADNIRHIKQVLNIGYDSMVFLDDNPFERNLVRTELPEVTVPELPKDPTEYMTYIRTLNLFETASYSEEDNSRTQRYQEEAKRLSNKKTFKSIGGYLESLEMKAASSAFNDFSVPRVAQLTQRSNQFNLRTIRYSEADIKKIKDSDAFVTNQVLLNDKYGAYGLISLVIGEKQGEKLFLDTWIMSCRVLKRDVEKFVLNELVAICKAQGVSQIVGEWIETKKNIIVKDHYKNLGFVEQEERWYLDVASYKPLKTYIQHDTE